MDGLGIIGPEAGEAAPLIIETGVPPPIGTRSTLSSVTWKETTEATVGGASVPTTKVEPVTVLDWPPPVTVDPLVQPTIASAAAASGRSANLNSFLRVRGVILGTSLSAGGRS